MKDSIIIPTVNLANLNKSPSTSNPCSPHTKFVSTPYEYDGCMLCVNGTPSCLQKRRATWTLKLRVALYCLSVLHPEKKYFNLKKDIYTYVDSHWDHLSINTAKSDRWRKQVQDSLSHCRHFESGWDAMGCNGHWRLIQPLNPWSLPPDKENSIYEDEELLCMTPESGLSPRTTKSPREDPLYRNFPKRRPMTMSGSNIATVSSFNDDEIENRKRKASDEERYTEEELVLLKYSPMIYSDTPSPKCRTPRSNNSSTTSPSILGNSPLLTSNGTHFSLANFNNNLTLNSPASSNSNGGSLLNPNNSIPNNITILENNSSPATPPQASVSPSLHSSSNSSPPPPIPSNPFSGPWKTNVISSNKQTTLFTTTNSVEEGFKVSPLPNPFSATIGAKNNLPGFSISNNSTLKVPSELLKSSINNSINLTNNSINNGNGSSGINVNGSNASSNNQQQQQVDSQVGSPNSSNLTKLQQQNLILNCTY